MNNYIVNGNTIEITLDNEKVVKVGRVKKALIRTNRFRALCQDLP